MKTSKIVGAPNNGEVVLKQKRALPHPKHLFPIHTMVAFNGHCGQGKTNAAINLAQAYFKGGYFTEVYLITPTIENNRKFFTLPLKEENVYENIQDVEGNLTSIQGKIQALYEEYEFKLNYAAAHKKWKAHQELTVAEFNMLERMDYEDPETPVRPIPLLICDDLSHSPIYSNSRNNPFLNLTFYHRHCVEGIGISIFMLVQSFKAIPRALRQNISIFCVFRTIDKSELQDLHLEIASNVTFPDFIRALDYATQEKYSFLLIDRYGENIFRKNFNTILRMPERGLMELLASGAGECGKRKRVEAEENETI